jgi:malonate-semialdehyde dehydrogenase (acetylating) / methylmalonate-semialdehyde dehydrogenase
MTTSYHLINGQLDIGSGPRNGPVFNPSLGTEIGTCAYADRATLDRAAKAAANAGRAWALSSHAARQSVIFKFRELLLANADRLAEVVGRENGKTLADARGEIARAVEGIEFATGAPHLSKGEFATNVGGGIDVFSMRIPVGVVGCIAPFNFPVLLPVLMSTLAIAVGNAIVLKGSEKVPTAALELARIFKEAGLPDGVFNVVQGDKETVDAILEHPGIEAISFVGSTHVGEYVYQKGTSHNKRVMAFAGAKNHMVVMPDADLDAAASAFVAAGFGAAGQRCMAISLAVPVGKETADRFIERVLPKVRALKVGPYNDPKSDFGALISSQSREAVSLAIDHCQRQGGKLVLDGRDLQVAGHESGYYMGASLFDEVTTEMDFYKEEVFGPVRGIVRASTFDDAVAIANTSAYGNGAAIFTRDGKAAHRFMMEVDAGTIGVNVPVPLPAGYFNFAGVRRSRFGESHLFGPEAVRFLTKLKTVSQRWPDPAQGDGPMSLAFPRAA